MCHTGQADLMFHAFKSLHDLCKMTFDCGCNQCERETSNQSRFKLSKPPQRQVVSSVTGIKQLYFECDSPMLEGFGWEGAGACRRCAWHAFISSTSFPYHGNSRFEIVSRCS